MYKTNTLDHLVEPKSEGLFSRAWKKTFQEYRTIGAVKTKSITVENASTPRKTNSKEIEKHQSVSIAHEKNNFGEYFCGAPIGKGYFAWGIYILSLGWILSPLKSIAKLVFEFPLRLLEEAFSPEQHPILHGIFYILRFTIRAILSPWENFLEAWRADKRLGVVSAVLSLAGFAAVIFFAAPYALYLLGKLGSAISINMAEPLSTGLKALASNETIAWLATSAILAVRYLIILALNALGKCLGCDVEEVDFTKVKPIEDEAEAEIKPGHPFAKNPNTITHNVSIGGEEWYFSEEEGGGAIVFLPTPSTPGNAPPPVSVAEEDSPASSSFRNTSTEAMRMQASIVAVHQTGSFAMKVSPLTSTNDAKSRTQFTGEGIGKSHGQVLPTAKH